MWTRKHTSLYLFIGPTRECRNYILKQSPSIDNALRNCLMRSTLICKSRKILFLLSTSGLFRMFASPGRPFWQHPMFLMSYVAPHAQKTGVRYIRIGGLSGNRAFQGYRRWSVSAHYIASSRWRKKLKDVLELNHINFNCLGEHTSSCSFSYL